MSVQLAMLGVTIAEIFPPLRLFVVPAHQHHSTGTNAGNIFRKGIDIAGLSC